MSSVERPSVPGPARRLAEAAAGFADMVLNAAQTLAWRASRLRKRFPDLSAFRFISVEFEGGTASFEYFIQHCRQTGKRLFAHHHALSTTESIPTRYLERVLDATGICTYDSEASRALFRSLGVHRTVQVGCTKFYPEWLARVRAMRAPSLGHGHVVLFLKKLHRPEFRQMTDDLLAYLARAHPGREVVIKVHPRESAADYLAHASGFGLGKVRVVFEPNFLVLREALCSISLPGTAILDSYALGVPCIEFHRPSDPASGYVPITQDSRLAGFPTADRIDQVAAFVAACLSDSWPTPAIVERLRVLPRFELFAPDPRPQV